MLFVPFELLILGLVNIMVGVLPMGTAIDPGYAAAWRGIVDIAYQWNAWFPLFEFLDLIRIGFSIFVLVLTLFVYVRVYEFFRGK